MTTPDINAILRAAPRNCQYGAPMGARSYLDEPDERLYLQRVRFVAEDDAHDPSAYRLKPPTIMIGNIEVPAPLREAPPQGTKYWCLMLNVSAGYGSDTWAGDGKRTYSRSDDYRLANGAIWLDEASAKLAAQALKTLLTGS